MLKTLDNKMMLKWYGLLKIISKIVSFFKRI